MSRLYWLYKLERMLIRISHLGISADIAAMGLCELWGAYRFLQLMAES
tara:strand:- start:10249 stop:10392 length:144 start_codon:yes stop_codon:yes gene_type:complete